jgi:hypothetical protein
MVVLASFGINLSPCSRRRQFKPDSLLEMYLAFIQSDQFKAESGIPTVDNTRIVVKMHPGSHPKARELLERNQTWVKNNDATLVIDTNLLNLCC